MDMDLISLLVFVGVIVIAFVCKVNTGLLAIVAALVLTQISGIADKDLLKMFDSKMFLMLLGVMYLFGIAEENKTLDSLAKKVINLCKGNVQLFPPLLFILSAVISAIGPGPISVTALMAAMTVALSTQIGVHPLKLLPFPTLGAFALGLTPLTPSGLVAIGIATDTGINGMEWPLIWKMAVTTAIYAAILYFFVFKWHKEKGQASITQEKTSPFTWKQWATLAGILLTAVLSVVLNINVGLVAIAVSVILTIMRVANEGTVLKKIPWSTLIMITGVGMLITVVTKLGGIDLLKTGLSALMNNITASPLMGILAGVMSWFSSASGVVMPTLIPTTPDLAANLSNVSALGMSISICVGAHLAALSPLSSCGGLMLAAYTSGANADAQNRNKVFISLFVISACGVLFAGLLALLGLY